MENYVFDLQYHLGKANTVADALSRKNQGIIASIALENWKTFVAIGDFDCNFVKIAIEHIFAI